MVSVVPGVQELGRKCSDRPKSDFLWMGPAKNFYPKTRLIALVVMNLLRGRSTPWVEWFSSCEGNKGVVGV